MLFNPQNPVKFNVHVHNNRGNTDQSELIGKWIHGKFKGYTTFQERVKMTWDVFLGKADVLYWKELP